MRIHVDESAKICARSRSDQIVQREICLRHKANRHVFVVDNNVHRRLVDAVQLLHGRIDHVEAEGDLQLVLAEGEAPAELASGLQPHLCK